MRKSRLCGGVTSAFFSQGLGISIPAGRHVGVKASGEIQMLVREGNRTVRCHSVGPWPVADGTCLGEQKGSCNHDRPRIYLRATHNLDIKEKGTVQQEEVGNIKAK